MDPRCPKVDPISAVFTHYTTDNNVEYLIGYYEKCEALRNHGLWCQIHDRENVNLILNLTLESRGCR